MTTISNPHPSLPSAIENDMFVNTLMKVTTNTDITDDTVKKHIWYCDIELSNVDGWRRTLKVSMDLTRRYLSNPSLLANQHNPDDCFAFRR